MSMIDLARFGSAHLNALAGKPSILSQAAAREIHTAMRDGYGLGWNVRENADSHLGGLEGLHTALLLIMKSEGKAFAIGVNAETDQTEVFVEVITAFRDEVRDG